MSALLILGKTDFDELRSVILNVSPDYKATEELWDILRKFFWNVYQSTDRGFNTS